MFLIKIATLLAFFVCLLVIAHLIKALSESKKREAAYRKQVDLLLVGAGHRETVLAIENDFNHFVSDDLSCVVTYVHGDRHLIKGSLTKGEIEVTAPYPYWGDNDDVVIGSTANER
ncbi:MAG TPA: hypothetical protein PLQ39_13685 [Acinetobacter sp.]|nr:hypothetical protein [Acinetobacter sp.]